MKKLAFSGYYGMQNYGDSLFQLASVLGARAYWGVDEPVILNHKPQGVSFKSLSTFEPTLILSEKYASLLRLYAMIVDSREMKTVVFSGGSLFGESRSLVMEIFIKVFSHRRNFFSAIGVSIGPFKRLADERRVARLLKGFDYISTRDKVSFERISEMGLCAKLNSSADLAGVLPLLSKEFTSPKPKSSKVNREFLQIGFSPCNVSDDREASFRFCEVFCNWVSLLSSTNCHFRVILIPLNYHYYYGDNKLISFTEHKLQSLALPYIINNFNGDIIKTWQSISYMDFYVSGRLHGAITSYLNSVPFFLFEYHEKCSEFLDFINMPPESRVLKYISKDLLYYEAFNRARLVSLDSLLPASRFSEIASSNFLGSPFCDPWNATLS